jgi:hypothetical protein
MTSHATGVLEIQLWTDSLQVTQTNGEEVPIADLGPNVHEWRLPPTSGLSLAILIDIVDRQTQTQPSTIRKSLVRLERHRFPESPCTRSNP